MFRILAAGLAQTRSDQEGHTEQAEQMSGKDSRWRPAECQPSSKQPISFCQNEAFIFFGAFHHCNVTSITDFFADLFLVLCQGTDFDLLKLFFGPFHGQKVFENILYVLGKDAYSAVVGGMFYLPTKSS